MCHYCDLSEYWGEDIPFKVKVDGTKQHYDVSILDDVDNDQFSLIVNGTFSEIRIKIDYCPMCGEEIAR